MDYKTQALEFTGRLLKGLQSGDEAAGSDLANLVEHLVSDETQQAGLKAMLPGAKVSSQVEDSFNKTLSTNLSEDTAKAYHESFGIPLVNPNGIPNRDVGAYSSREASFAASLWRMRKPQLPTDAEYYGAIGDGYNKLANGELSPDAWKLLPQPNTIVGGKRWSEPVVNNVPSIEGKSFVSEGKTIPIVNSKLGNVFHGSVFPKTLNNIVDKGMVPLSKRLDGEELQNFLDTTEIPKDYADNVYTSLDKDGGAYDIGTGGGHPEGFILQMDLSKTPHPTRYSPVEGGLVVHQGDIPFSKVNAVYLNERPASDEMWEVIHKLREKYPRVRISFPSSRGGITVLGTTLALSQALSPKPAKASTKSDSLEYLAKAMRWRIGQDVAKEDVELGLKTIGHQLGSNPPVQASLAPEVSFSEMPRIQVHAEGVDDPLMTADLYRDPKNQSVVKIGDPQGVYSAIPPKMRQSVLDAFVSKVRDVYPDSTYIDLGGGVKKALPVIAGVTLASSLNADPAQAATPKAFGETLSRIVSSMDDSFRQLVEEEGEHLDWGDFITDTQMHIANGGTPPLGTFGIPNLAGWLKALEFSHQDGESIFDASRRLKKVKEVLEKSKPDDLSINRSEATGLTNKHVEFEITHPELGLIARAGFYTDPIKPGLIQASVEGYGPAIPQSISMPLLRRISALAQEEFPGSKIAFTGRVTGIRTSPTNKNLLGLGGAITAASLLDAQDAEAQVGDNQPQPSARSLSQPEMQASLQRGIVAPQQSTITIPLAKGAPLGHQAPTYDSIVNSQQFQQLPKEAQLKIRQHWWETVGQFDQRIQRLPPEKLQQVRAKILASPIPGTNSPERLVSQLVEGAISGLRDPQSASRAQTFPGQPQSIAETGARMVGMAAQYGALTRAAGPILGDAAGVLTKSQDVLLDSTIGAIQQPLLAKQEQMATLQSLASKERDQETFHHDAAATQPDLAGEAVFGATVGPIFQGALAGISGMYSVGKGLARGTYGLLAKEGMLAESKKIAAGEIPKAIEGVEKVLEQSPENLDPITQLLHNAMSDGPRLVIANPPKNVTRKVAVILKDGTQIDPEHLALGSFVAKSLPQDEEREALKSMRLVSSDMESYLGRNINQVIGRGWVARAGGRTPLFRFTNKFFDEYEEVFTKKVGWGDVAEVRGSQDQVNRLLRMTGQPIQIRDVNPLSPANGYNVTRSGAKFLARSADETYEFNTKRELEEFLSDVPTPNSVRIEQEAMQALGKEGRNSFSILPSIKKETKQSLETMARLGDGGSGGVRYLDGPPPDTSALYGNPSLKFLISRKVGIPKQTFLRGEAESGIPMYSQVWKPIEDARVKMESFMNPWVQRGSQALKDISKGQREGYALALETQPGSEARKSLVDEFKLDEMKLTQIEGVLGDYFKQYNLSAESYFRKYLPEIKSAGGVDRAYSKTAIPREVKFFENDLKNGTIPWWKSEQSINELFNSHLHRAAHNAFLSPVWDRASELANGMFDENKIDPAYAKAVKNYLDEVQGRMDPGWDKAMVVGLGKAFNGLSKKFNKLDPGEEITTKEAEMAGRKMIGWLFSMSYSANIMMRPAIIARHMLQFTSTTFPRFGNAAFRGALRLGTEEGQNLVKRSGLLLEDAPMAAEEGMRAWGGRGFQAVVNLQRSVAGLAQDTKIQTHLSRYKQTGDWSTFAARSKLDKMHPIVQADLKKMIDGGQETLARLQAMRHASEDTQGIYRRANRPEVFTGLGGRFLGQYGVWHANFANYLGTMWARGSYTGRAGETLRFITANAAIGAALKESIGADATHWTWFSPLSFQGGPMFQLAKDIVASTKDDTEGDLARGRLKRAPLQFIPGKQAALDLWGVVNSKDPQEATRHLLGYPKAK